MSEVRCTITIEMDANGGRTVTINGHGRDIRDIIKDVHWLGCKIIDQGVFEDDVELSDNAPRSGG